MLKKNNYVCLVCNTSWECYVFTEFATPFSTCKYCFVDADDIVKKNSPLSNVCSLCDTAKECFKIPLHNNPVRQEMMLCKECFFRLKELIIT